MTRSHAGKNTLGMKIWFFILRRRKGKCPKLMLPWQGPGVVLVQICDMVIKIKMGPRALPRFVHADRLRAYTVDQTPSWIAPALEAEAKSSTSADAGGSCGSETVTDPHVWSAVVKQPHTSGAQEHQPKGGWHCLAHMGVPAMVASMWVPKQRP